MRCAWRALGSGADWARVRAGLAGLVVALAVCCFVAQAHAQVGPTSSPSPSPTPTPTPSPTPSPTPTPMAVNGKVATQNQVVNLGGSFLERLLNQTTNGVSRDQRNNPGGGGASEATADGLRFRSWTELYGVYMTTSAQGAFVGDRRTTAGGVAGLGVTLMPGVNIGFSVDQSRTDIDVPLALQSASLNLTQFGFNASVDKGPWTWAIAVVHGFGNVNANRDTGFGIANSGYEAQLDGVLTEIDYYWTKDQSRIVPKAGLEYVHSTTSAFQEVGGLDPVTVSASTVERSQLLLGAEVGHYFIFDQKILDLSAYGKFVDNFAQDFGSVLVSLGPQSISVAGIGESQYGADAGAAASLSLTNTARLYLNYDGKFRANLQSHQATLGFEYKW
ncbi:MAG TPA: autotransporter outer membrane beta-barrel domain-containing protein [Bradyrhizobium sp.]|nr:autotransporter outer membrane beta-barrel domain-containing protein [Bradyrhizobium sp.]